jgi:hypothetical protein
MNYSNLEQTSGVLEEMDNKNMDRSSSLTRNEQEKQLECILVSILKLSKEFVDIEEKMSVERNENRFVSVHLRYTCFPATWSDNPWC